MGVEKKLTPREKEMFIRGLEQALIYIDGIKEIMEDPSQPSNELDAVKSAIERQIAWHKNGEKYLTKF